MWYYQLYLADENKEELNFRRKLILNQRWKDWLDEEEEE